MRTFESATGRDNSSPSRSRAATSTGRAVAPLRPSSYRADLTIRICRPVRTYVQRRQGDDGEREVAGKGVPPPTETTSAKIQANCGVGVGFSCSPRHPWVQPANEFTEACPTTFCLFRYPSRLTPRSFPSLLASRCVGFLTASVFALFITRFCNEIERTFLHLRDTLQYLLFPPSFFLPLLHFR